MTKVKADFTDDAQGWTVTGNALTSGFVPVGGNPNGFFGFTGGLFGDTVYYNASDEFTGNLSSYFHGKLSYDVFDTVLSNLSGEPDVKIVGANGHVLVAEVGQAGLTFDKFTVQLDDNTAWHMDTLDGHLASDKQIKAVLKDVDQLLIRGEYSTLVDVGGIDNVALKSSGHAIRPFQDASGAFTSGHGDTDALAVHGSASHGALHTEIAHIAV